MCVPAWGFITHDSSLTRAEVAAFSVSGTVSATLFMAVWVRTWLSAHVGHVVPWSFVWNPFPADVLNPTWVPYSTVIYSTYLFLSTNRVLYTALPSCYNQLPWCDVDRYADGTVLWNAAGASDVVQKRVAQVHVLLNVIALGVAVHHHRRTRHA
jgi:hypothetical protein